MSVLRVVGLFQYPVKGMRGRPMEEARVMERGLEHDRRFMLVDPDGQFITQRECPALATLEAAFDASSGRLSIVREMAGARELLVQSWWSLDDELEPVQVTVWKDTFAVVARKDPADDKALSRQLGRPVKIVYLPDSSVRPSRKQVPGGEMALTGFADAYPFLLTNIRSLEGLNQDIKQGPPTEMARFRANIVVDGDMSPFAEEAWRVFTIGGVKFYGMKRCARCVVTTTDQRTGERMGKEPLATLVRTRLFGKDACFGMNLNHAGTGVIRVGDPVEIMEEGPPFFEN